MQTVQNSAVTFEVRSDPSGGYSARARVGNYSLITQGDSLDELHKMIEDLIEDYNANESSRIARYALLFTTSRVAA